jgi:hypothetical protein
MARKAFCYSLATAVATFAGGAHAQTIQSPDSSARVPMQQTTRSLWHDDELTAEGVAAVSSPVGRFGGYLRYRFLGYVAVEAGFGTGGSVDADRLQLAAGVRFNVPLLRRPNLYLALSFGSSISTGSYNPTSLATGPSDIEWKRANWLNYEIGPEFRYNWFHARVAVGHGRMLNPNDGRIDGSDVSHGTSEDSLPLMLAAVGASY